VIEFYKTMAGRRFFEGDLPRLVLATERLASAFERLAIALETQALADTPAPAASQARAVEGD
jgi:hypothetical protein